MDLTLCKGTHETLRIALGLPQNMSSWYMSQALEGKDVKDLLLNVGSGGGAAAAPATSGATGGAAPAEAAKEEEKEEGMFAIVHIPETRAECRLTPCREGGIG